MPITRRNLRKSMKKYNLSNKIPTRPTNMSSLFKSVKDQEQQVQTKIIRVDDTNSMPNNTNTTEQTTKSIMSNLRAGNTDLIIEQCTGESLSHRNYDKVLKTKEQFIRNMEKEDKDFHDKLHQIQSTKPSFDVWFDEESTYESKIKDFHKVNENKRKRVDRSLSTWNTKVSYLNNLLKEYYRPNDTRTKLEIVPIKVFNRMLQDKIVYSLDDIRNKKDLTYFSLEYNGYIYNINCDSENRNHFNVKLLTRTIKHISKIIHREMVNKWCQYLKEERYQYYCSKFRSILPVLPKVDRIESIKDQDIVEMCNYACNNGKIVLLQYMPTIAENYGKEKQLNKWVVNNYNRLLTIMDEIQINKFFDSLYQCGVLNSRNLAAINNINIKSRDVLNVSDNGLAVECRNCNYGNAKDILKFPHVDNASWNYNALRNLPRDNNDSIQMYEQYRVPGRYDPVDRKYIVMM